MVSAHIVVTWVHTTAASRKEILPMKLRGVTAVFSDERDGQ